MGEAERTRELQKAMSVEALPSLPGIKPRAPHHSAHHKAQRFTVHGDGRVEKDFPVVRASHAMPDDIVGHKEALLKQWQEIVETEKLKRFAEEQNAAADLALRSMRLSASTPALRVPPSWLKHARDVLRFFMFFQEPVFESQTESFRVRKCVCYFYLEDGSIAITEPKECNSGLSQGSFLKRAVLAKPDGTPYLPEDFLPGSEVTIHGRTFRCVDLDQKSCDFFAMRGMQVPATENYPEDEHRKKQRVVAEQAEAKLTAKKAAKSKSPLGGLKGSDQTLKFSAMWDDSARLYGEKNFYTLNFYLADETMEIRMVNRPSKDTFPVLLKRSKLPRDLGNPDAGHVTAAELVCGTHLDCYGRKIMILKCADEFTAGYYERVHNVKQSVVHIREAPKSIVKKVIPPYNGFGSEADSLANCLNLIPKPVSQDLHRFLNNRGKTLKFRAKFVNPGPEDLARDFLITYYMDDDTVAVYEPPRRNSGILGGKFLERGKYKKPILEKARTSNDLQLLKDTILEKIQSRMVGGPYTLLRAFRRFGTDDAGNITFENFKIGLRSIGINESAFPDELLRQLFRLYDNSGDMKIDYQEFVDHVMQDRPIAANETRFSSRWLRGSDFYVGAIIQFMFPQTGARTQEFRILSADRETLDMMSDNPAEFPKSNVEAIAAMLAETLGENHVNVFEAFRNIDTEGKGWIHPEQFGHLLKAWALDFGLIAEELSDHEMQTLVRHYDRDSDGRIFYNEFADALKQKTAFNTAQRDDDTAPIEEAMAALFEKLQALREVDLLSKFIELDDDRSGRLSWEEFQLMLRRYDIYLNNDRDKTFLMLKFDKNRDGLIDYKEFCDTLFSTEFVKEDGQIKKKLVPRDIREILGDTGAQDSHESDVKMYEYQALLQVAQAGQTEQVRARAMMTDFVGKFVGRRKLLLKVFASFDIEGTGRVGMREFVEALTRANPDYARTHKFKLVAYLFPDPEGELVYQPFLDIFFSQDVEAALSTYGNIPRDDQPSAPVEPEV